MTDYRLEFSGFICTFQSFSFELSKQVKINRTYSFIKHKAPSGSLWGRFRYFHSSLQPTSQSSGTPGYRTEWRGQLSHSQCHVSRKM